MNKIVSYDQGIATGDVRDLSEIQKNLSNASPEHPFVAGFSAFSKGVGLPAVAQKAVEKGVEPHMPRHVKGNEAKSTKDHFEWPTEGIM
jgi:hypothetical protein